jgi:hypothetical protein
MPEDKQLEVERYLTVLLNIFTEITDSASHKVCVSDFYILES